MFLGQCWQYIIQYYSSRTAVKYFDVKYENVREHIHSACEYIMFTPTKLFRNWCKQWPSNNCDLDSKVKRAFGRICYKGVVLHLIILFNLVSSELSSGIYCRVK
jgi:hypothetical protein